MKIYLGDLTHNYGLRTRVVPMGIATLACAVHDNFGEKVITKLFAYPDKIIEDIKKNPPDVIALSNYIWNSRLSLRILRLAKKINPKILTIMGGPHARTDPKALKKYLKENLFVDAYIPFEAEVPFVNLVGKCLEKKSYEIRDLEKVAGVYLNIENYNFERAVLESDKIKNPKFNSPYYTVNRYSSPYLNGMLDEFLKDPNLSPMLESNRGCPYSCTFCAWGVASGNKLIKKDLHRFLSEIWYVGERSRNDLWFLADGNFGIVKEDVIIAENFKKINQKYGYPKQVNYNTAKNNPERVYEVANILGEMAQVNIAVQAFDPEVLKKIKRKNLKNDEIVDFITKHQKKGRVVTTDLLVPNSGEDLVSHLNSIRTFFDLGFDSISTNILRMLPGTEMESDEEREKYGFKTKWRPMDAGWGEYEKEFVFEVDENIVASSDMSEKDMHYLKKVHFMLNLLWTTGAGKPLLKLAKNNGMNPTNLILNIIKDENSSLSNKILNPLVEEFKNEWFKTRDELIDYFSNPKNSKEILSGKKGLKKLNLKYLARMIVQKTPLYETIPIIKDHLKTACKINEEIIDVVAQISIDSLRLDLINGKLTKSIFYKVNFDNFNYLKDIKIIPENIFYTKDGFTINYKFSKEKHDKLSNRLIKYNFDKIPEESLYSAFTAGLARFLYVISDNKNLASMPNTKSQEHGSISKGN